MNKKKIFAWFFILIMILCACHNDRQVSQNDAPDKQGGQHNPPEATEEPLVVFYNQLEYANVVSNYEKNYPEDNVKFYYVSDILDSSGFPAQYGVPDVFLLSTSGWYWAASLEQYCTEIPNISFLNMAELQKADDSFAEDNYFPGVLEMGQWNGELVALPLSIMLPYMTLREEAYGTSAFGLLGKDYTGLDMIDASIEELSKEREDGYVVFDIAWQFQNFLYILDAVHESEDGGFTVDKGIFEKIYDLNSLDRKNRETVQAQTDNSLIDLGLFPMDNEGKILASIGRAVPQIGYLYAANANWEWFKQDTRIMWYSIPEDSAGYRAEVDMFGMINAQTSKQERAYEFLRNCMDMSVQEWSGPNESFRTASYCPINRDAAKAMLTLVNESDLSHLQLEQYHTGKKHVIEGKPLSQAQCEEVAYVLDHISQIYSLRTIAEREAFGNLVNYFQSDDPEINVERAYEKFIYDLNS